MALAGEIQVKRGHCEEGFTFYREATALCPELHAVHTATLMILNYIPSLTSREIYEEHRRWASRYADPLSEGQPSFLNEANPNRRLRIGYVIPELKRHAVLNFSEPMLHHHDRTQFCLYAYTNRNSADDRTAELAGLFDVVRDTQGLDDERLARTIRQDQIDILVDLCGQTKDHRLLTFARRAAPIQLNSVAYPNTTGLTAMDYRITDEIADPRGEPICHTEELIRLPTGFCCYQPPKEDIPIEPLPALTNGYVTFGATHALQKLNSQVLDLYCEVLKAIPSAKLYLFRSTLSPSQQGYFRDAFAERGIAAERVSMEYRLPASGSHLSAYNTMDIHLDSFPWNGHTTTCDALWMGVPTITLRGDRHASRMAASVLHRIGLDDFVAGSPEHFIRIASKWNADREVLSRLRIALRSRMLDSPLCDGRAYTHAMEAEYRRIWGIWCATHI